MTTDSLKNALFSTYAFKKSQQKLVLSELNNLLQKNQENLPKLLELLKDNYKENQQQPEFKYFLKIFLVIKRKIKFSKQNLENVKQFFNVFLVYARRYTPVHFSEEVRNIFDKLCTVIRDVPEEVVLEKYSSSPKDKALLTHLILNVLKKADLIREDLLKKLNSDYLIDLNKQTKSGFKFDELHADLLDQQQF